MSTLYVRNWRVLALTIAMCLLAGFAALEALPRREDPELTKRNALVTVRVPGADAQRVEQLVTERLEEVLKSFEEIKELVSTSRAGIATLSIELKDHIHDVDRVYSEMRDDLARAEADLPAEASRPELIDLEVDASAAIFALSAAPGREIPWSLLQRTAETFADHLRAVRGTKRVTLHGEIDEEVSVLIAPHKLVQLGLSPDALSEALRAGDAKAAAGRVRSARSDLGIEVFGAYETLDQIARLPIKIGDGQTTVPLRELATVDKSLRQPQRAMAFVDGEPAIFVAALADSDLRLDRWAQALDQELAAFQSGLPAGMELRQVFDQRRYTEVRLTELAGNLGIAAGLVALVVALFMGLRAALVVSISLPLASAMVLAGMNLLGIPIHQMSVTGLIIALGLLIDNAIVMTDEVRHRMRDGLSGPLAVRDAVHKLGIPLAGSTLTTILSFLPIALMPGAAGEFVGSIAVSVILAVLSSFFLALTVVPALSARLGRGAVSSWHEHGLDFAFLRRLGFLGLKRLIAVPLLAVALGVALPIAGFLAAGGLTEQFFPPSERDQFQIELRMDPGTAIARTAALAGRARELLLQSPEVDAVHWFIGESAPKFYYNQLESESEVPWYASALVQLKAPLKNFSLLRQFQLALDERLPEGQWVVRALEQGPPVAAPLEFEFRGPDQERLLAFGDQWRARLSLCEGITHTRASAVDGVPQWSVVPDSVEALAAGYSHVDLARLSESHLEGAIGGVLVEGPETLPIRVRLAESERGDIATLRDLPVVMGAAGDGTYSRFGEWARFELTPTFGDIEHIDGERANTIMGYLVPGVLAATVLRPLREEIERFPLPPNYELKIAGESKQRDQAVGQLLSSVAVLLGLMVATLVLTFSSFRLMGLLALVGFGSAGLALLALRLFNLPFGFTAIIGTMGLIGVALNDSIVVLAAIRGDARARGGDREAIALVTLRSMRHVLATTATTAVGFLPLFLGGGGFWPPVAVTIGMGVIGATFLALVFVPGAYALMHRERALATDPV